MIIPLPCIFGEKAICNGKILPLKGVSWFHWSNGIEYTYFFAENDYWHDTDFYATYDTTQSFQLEISNELLADKFIKEHGFPLKGRGYASGIAFVNDKTYIDFIMTSNYLTHIKVQCDEIGNYVPNGDIIFPPSWDTDDKRDNAILKAYKFIEGKPLVIKEPEPKQMTIFDLVS